MASKKSLIRPAFALAVLLKSVTIWTLIASIAYITPIAKKSYFRNVEGRHVVKIAVTGQNGGHWFGTGFHLQLPSGKVAILTNRHVCDGAAGGQVTILVNDIPHTKKIIEMSRDHDLCLVEPVLKTGARLASSTFAGDSVVTLGHPSAYPLTMTEGEVIGYEKLQFFEPYQGKGTCKWDNQQVQIVMVPLSMARQRHVVYMPTPKHGYTGLLIPVKACITTEVSVTTTSMIKPGSSGSPAFNLFGNVIGIQHASSSEDNWGRMVALENIKKFIRKR